MDISTIKDYIFSYGVVCGTRRSDTQKKRFLRMAKKQFTYNGFQVQVTKSKISFFKIESKNIYNMYIGDVKKAKYIFITYYDTPRKAILPSYQEAFHPCLSKANIYIDMSIAVLFLISMLSLAYTALIPNLNTYGVVSMWGILCLCIILFSFYLMKHLRGGIANRNNMVRNSSSIITLVAFASQLCDKQKKEIAFVFLDEGTNSEYGLHMLDAYIREQRSTRIYLDSIGNEGDIHCFTNLNCSFTHHDVVMHPLHHDDEKYGDILLTAGIYEKERIIIKGANSSGNKVLNEGTIKRRVDVLQKLLQKIETS